MIEAEANMCPETIKKCVIGVLIAIPIFWITAGYIAYHFIAKFW